MREFLPGQIVRHFKRETVDPSTNDYLYKITGIAIHSESKEKYMVYQGLYGACEMYIRPLEMFMSEVDHEKYPDIKQKYRFEAVCEQESSDRNVLVGIQPESVWKYFEKICDIPHGSHNEQQISEYIESQAVKMGFRYVRDDYNNIVIWAPGTLGSENREPVILQGHMDMVAEKLPDCDIDMMTEGLRLKYNGEEVYAEGTTLGGDDGVAVAYMLALLEDTADSNPTIKHPPLECVFTTDEECGMSGASGLDMTLLKGRTMINLDSEDEGYLLVSCAGGAAATLRIKPVDGDSCGCEGNSDHTAPDMNGKTVYKVIIKGLKGGHSGCDIHLGRANADILMGRFMDELCDVDYNAVLCSINGGNKDNVIPNQSEAVVALENEADLLEVVKEMQEILTQEYADTDPDIAVCCEAASWDGEPLSYGMRDKVIAALNTLPCGVQKMSEDMEGLPETSLSLGVMKTLEGEVSLTYLIRSSVDEAKEELIEKIMTFAQSIDAEVTVSGKYPGWAYRKESPLRDMMYEVFKDMYGRAPVVQAIHAGVECGMFARAIEDFDAVSIGPDMKDIHTPNEKLNVESTGRVWEYLLAVLGRI